MIISNRCFATSLLIFATLGASSHCYSRIVASLTGGWAISNDSWDTNTLPVIDDNHYHYDVNNSHQNNGIWGLFVGNESILNDDWVTQVGLAYYSSSLFTISGNVTQGMDAGSADTFPYRWRIRSQQLLLDSKWLYYWREKYHPYLLAGIGAGFNQGQGYQVDIPPCFTFSPQFANHNITSLAFSVGFGMDYDFKPNIRAGFGYRFFDLGKTELGDGPVDDVPNSRSLSQAHLFQHVFFGQLTWLF